MAYNTKQRATIEAFLQENAARHICAKEIIAYTQPLGIGAATVYRSLDLLTAQGKVRKFIADGAACYQWGDACNHYHFVCEGCGKCFHVDCEKLDEIDTHMTHSHGFHVDLSKTVFCGKCDNCIGKEKS